MFNNKNYLYWLAVLSLVLLLLDKSSRIEFIKEGTDRMIIPVKKNIFNIYGFSTQFFSAVSKYSQLDKLSKDLLEAKQEREELTLQVSMLREENNKLRVQLESPLPSSFKFIPARVVSLSRFMEIDMGFLEGVRENMPVVEGTTYIGKIKAVNPHRSQIILPWDLDSNIPVKTIREAKGVAVGQSGKTIVFDKVLQKDQLFLADQVITSGEDNLPANLLFGKIVHITSDETGVYKKAKIEPSINYEEIRYVFVISSTN